MVGRVGVLESGVRCRGRWYVSASLSDSLRDFLVSGSSGLSDSRDVNGSGGSSSSPDVGSSSCTGSDSSFFFPFESFFGGTTSRLGFALQISQSGLGYLLSRSASLRSLMSLRL